MSLLCILSFLVRMAFEDFCRYFTNATLCHVLNKSILSLRKRWHVFKHSYRWTPGTNAGGCVENRSTFLKNPQVREYFWALISSLGESLVPHVSAKRPRKIGFAPMIEQKYIHHRKMGKLPRVLSTRTFQGVSNVK